MCQCMLLQKEETGFLSQAGWQAEAVLVIYDKPTLALSSENLTVRLARVYQRTRTHASTVALSWKNTMLAYIFIHK